MGDDFIDNNWSYKICLAFVGIIVYKLCNKNCNLN